MRTTGFNTAQYKITRTNARSLRRLHRFNKKEWHKLDKEHYGKEIARYVERPFRFHATRHGRILGVIKGSCDLGVVFIQSLIVGSSERRRGIGQALMARAEQFGKQLGCHKVFLFTGKDWQANSFYRKLGFKQVAVLQDHYHHKDFLVYEKPLG